MRKSLFFLLASAFLAGCVPGAKKSGSAVQVPQVAWGLASEPETAFGSDARAQSAVAVWTRGGLIFARTVSYDGKLGEKRLVYSSRHTLDSPKVVSSREGWYVIWRERIPPAKLSPGGYLWLAQHLSPSGGNAWPVPSEIAVTSYAEFDVRAVPSADDAAILAWNEGSLTQKMVYVCAAKLSRDGSFAWRAELGKGERNSWYQSPILAADEKGGAFLAFRQLDSVDRGIVVERLSPDGRFLWDGGYDLYDSGGYSAPPALVSDGKGGVIAVWADSRNGDSDIYAQRIGLGPAPLWEIDGLVVALGEGNQSFPAAASDGDGGVYIAWADDLKTGARRLKLQRINSKGEAVFPSSGVEPSAETAPKQWNHSLMADGSGGVFLSWTRAVRDGYEIAAQHFDSGGHRLWNAGGGIGIPFPVYSRPPRICADGSGGLLLVWQTKDGEVWEVRSARSDSSGSVVWRR